MYNAQFDIIQTYNTGISGRFHYAQQIHLLWYVVQQPKKTINTGSPTRLMCTISPSQIFI